LLPLSLRAGGSYSKTGRTRWVRSQLARCLAAILPKNE
jgi:hypothetical protein